MNLQFLRAMARYGSMWLLALSLGACSRASYPLLFRSALLGAGPATAPVVPVKTYEATPDTLAAVVVAPAPAAIRHPAQPMAKACPRIRVMQQVTALAHALPQLRQTSAAAWYQVAPPDQPAPVRYRSRSIAFLLDLVMLVGPFTVVLAPVSLALIFYNYYVYLGYYPQGIASILFLAVSLALVFAGFDILRGNSNPEANLAGVILLALWAGWHLVNLVRIATGNLKPRGGEYYPRASKDQPPATPLKP